MDQIYNCTDLTAMRKLLRDMGEAELQAQTFVQQGAIHAVSFLLANGCDADTASQMLASMRQSSQLIRDEANRRGLKDLFPVDQIENPPTQ